jgi:peptidoglycan/LPS O-acetylase OafA/YrhL
MGWLDHLADASFTIYFLHLYVIYCVVWLTQQRSIEVSVPAFALLLVAAVAVPTLIAWIARRLAPQWSRSLVGS